MFRVGERQVKTGIFTCFPVEWLMFHAHRHPLWYTANGSEKQLKKQKQAKKREEDTMVAPPLEMLLEAWLADVEANDHAPGTVRRYRSAIRSFFAWYSQEEQRSFTLECLSPITLIGYRNFLQRIQRRATSTVNGHISALRAWCAWLTEEHLLETNPAKRIKLVGRQEASSREGLSPNQVNALLRQVQTSPADLV